MVSNNIQVQTLTNTKSSLSGAIESNWSNTAIITGTYNILYTIETIKGIRTYTNKVILLTKYPNLNVENTRLIISSKVYVITRVTHGAWYVVECREEEVC